MKYFIYAIFACLLALTGCEKGEPGYGYKEPVVYFSRAGILATKVTGNEIPVSVYCSGDPDRGTVTVSVAVERSLYDSFKDKKDYQLIPESFYSTATWTVDIPKNEQVGIFKIPVQLSAIGKGKYVLPLKLTNSSPFELLKDKEVLYLTFIIE